MPTTAFPAPSARRASPPPPGWSPPEDLPEAEIDGPDIFNGQRFLVKRNVPILDVHRHLDKGTIDRPLLELIARNSNARAAAGDYALILIGHTDPDVPETHQPPVVGYAAEFKVGRLRDRVCLLADFHIRKSEYDLAMTFPRRSVERASGRLPGSNYIDSIALLRTIPERSLGLLTHYSRATASSGMTVRGQSPRRQALARLAYDIEMVAQEQRRIRAEQERLRVLSNRPIRKVRLESLAKDGYQLVVDEELKHTEKMSASQFTEHCKKIVTRYRRDRPASPPTTGLQATVGGISPEYADVLSEAKQIYKYARENKYPAHRYQDAVRDYMAAKRAKGILLGK